MNSRERVIRAIERSGPDRIPIVHALLGGALAKHGERLTRLLERYPSDCGGFGGTGAGEFSGRAWVESTDTWGCVWVSATDDYKGHIIQRPLESWAGLDHLRPPRPIVPPEDLAHGREVVQANRGEKYLSVDGDCLWQRMFYLRGYDAILMDLLAEPERAAKLRDMILDFMLARLRLWLELDIDGVMLRDDWGTQESLMISPALWRSFFKPAYREISNLVHGAGRHLWFHSDGVIESIIPDMIEIGVDVINPQVSIMGIERLGRTFGGRACFLGDIDRQVVLPFGTPDEVRAIVAQTVGAFGGFGGGYIGRGEIGPDVPIENAEAMFAALIECGTYRAG